jgi:chromosome segregation ATPase
MSSPDVSRKVRQLDNDVQAIYEVLGRIETGQTRQGGRLDEIEGKLTTIEATQNTVQATQARQGNRLDEMDGKLDTQGDRLDAMDSKLDRLIELLEGK